VNSDGLIIRNEEVLVSPFSGKCIKEVSEGEKIPANYRVATILNNSSEKTVDEIKKLDLRITAALKEKAKNQDIFSDDIKKLDAEIDKYLDKFIEAGNSNKFSGLRECRNEINDLIQKKSMILDNTGASNSFLSSLLNTKKNLENQLSRIQRTSYQGLREFYLI
jgi:uncharacterized protein with ATP-grasp and redox domains